MLSQFSQLHSAFHDFNTRNRNNLVVPSFARSLSQHSFLYRSVREFNSLPHDLKISCILSVFKSKLKNQCSSAY